MKDFLKKFLGSEKSEDIKPVKNATTRGVISRPELEVRVKEGAEKAMSEYRRVFERLAEYDRV